MIPKTATSFGARQDPFHEYWQEMQHFCPESSKIICKNIFLSTLPSLASDWLFCYQRVKDNTRYLLFSMISPSMLLCVSTVSTPLLKLFSNFYLDVSLWQKGLWEREMRESKHFLVLRTVSYSKTSLAELEKLRILSSVFF